MGTERQVLADQLRLTARRLYPDDDTPQKLDAVLEEVDRAVLDGIWDELFRIHDEWYATGRREPFAVILMSDAAERLRDSMLLKPVARYWKHAT